MTQKISPLAFRLGVSSSWLSTSHSYPLNTSTILSNDLFIRSLIQGILLKFSIFSSPIIIKRSPNGSLFISLFFWDASPHFSFSPLFNLKKDRNSLFKLYNILIKSPKKFSKIYILSSFILLLISKLYNINPLNIHLHFSEIPSPIYNAKILCDYMSYRISLDPYYHKSIVTEAIRASS